MTTGIIYAVRNKASGKRYIGQTTSTINKRWQQHVRAARRGSKSPFHCALRVYGPDAWEITILHEIDGTPGELDIFEQTAIREWQVQNRAFGYNILDGGSASPARLPEVRAKIAATLKGHKRSQESIARQVAARKGYHHSADTKRKIRETNRLTKANGISEETRQLMRVAALKRPLPDAFKTGHPAWNTRRKS